MSKTWNILEALFTESKQYRGASGLTLKTINDLLVKTLGMAPGNPEGGVVSCNHKFSPDIWKGWTPRQDGALGVAASEPMNAIHGSHAGKAQGALTVKTNWGGQVSQLAGKARTDFERLPSAMDKYDVLMQGEIEGKKGLMTRMAYSPSIGSYEERKARLVALISGQAPPPLSRRPQPERPEPSKDDLEKWSKLPAPQPVMRQGQNAKLSTKKSED